MHRTTAVLFCALALCASGTVSAQPPAGKFSKLYPEQMRYAVTLFAVPPKDGLCIPGAEMMVAREEDGSLQKQPFVVPDKSTFVLTDAHLRLSLAGPTIFTDQHTAWMNIFVNHIVDSIHTEIWAEETRGRFAMADHAFQTGVSFEAGSIICVNSATTSPDHYSELAEDEVIFHGYVIDYGA